MSKRALRSALIGACTLASVLIAPISANAALIYNNIPAPLPGNLPSEGFEATSTAEFGGLVEFAGTVRKEPTISAVMSSWACEFGSGTTCATVPGATFSQRITLKIYKANAVTDEPEGGPIATTQQTFDIPYRPTASKKCVVTPEGQGWGKECFHGKTHVITFHPTEVTLPAKAIISIAYNTQNYGAEPTGTSGPYDSLNVAVTEPKSKVEEEVGKGGVPPAVGLDPLPEYTYINSTYLQMYEPEPHGLVGTFSLANGWTGYQPVFKVTAKK